MCDNPVVYIDTHWKEYDDVDDENVKNCDKKYKDDDVDDDDNGDEDVSDNHVEDNLK